MRSRPLLTRSSTIAPGLRGEFITTVRITTGSLRGRLIPYSPRGHGDVRVTSAKLKEALFAMLGGSLHDQTFLDVCSGSGQIALEACSRGARVTANEPDPRRHARLENLIAEWRPNGLDLFSLKAQILIPRLDAEGRRFDTIYLDPPYQATSKGQPLSVALLELLGESNLLDTAGVLMVQHSVRLDLPDASGPLILQRRRPYGDTALSLYRMVT